MNLIVIPVHNQLDYLKKCIYSVELNTPKCKILLINDGSDKGTTEWIEKSKYEFIHNKKAQGYSTACNQGIEWAIKHKQRVVCLLNSDTEIKTENWYEKVKSKIYNNICVAGVVGNNAGHQTIEVKNPDVLALFDRVFVNVLIHGFCYFLNLDVLKKIGSLDAETFPHYGSEDDLCIRATKHGYRNIIYTGVYVFHHKSKSYTEEVRSKIMTNSVPALSERWGERNVRNYCLGANRILTDLRKKIIKYEHSQLHSGNRRERRITAGHRLFHRESE